jgi:triacylglycerol esterase/lipase EstA (alpha/beta hydrolase family)
MSSVRKTVFSVMVTTVVLLAVGVASASAALPVKYSFLEAQKNSLLGGSGSPPGANDWNCRPSQAHPRPVILVHGTVENQKSNWSAASPVLKNDGYCVYTLNFGSGLFTVGQFYGLDPVASDAAELKSFVTRVQNSTGSSKVDLVGHSLGGLVARYYMQKLGGSAQVANLVGLAATNNGTSFSGIAGLAKVVPGLANLFVFSWCKSCKDQIAGSAVLASVNAGGGTSPNVNYTNIATKYDEIATPYTTAFLSGSNVTNITVQDGCSKDRSEHLALPYDQRALWYVRKALDPALTGSAPCVPVTPLIGG